MRFDDKDTVLQKLAYSQSNESSGVSLCPSVQHELDSPSVDEAEKYATFMKAAVKKEDEKVQEPIPEKPKLMQEAPQDSEKKYILIPGTLEYEYQEESVFRRGVIFKYLAKFRDSCPARSKKVTQALLTEFKDALMNQAHMIQGRGSIAPSLNLLNLQNVDKAITQFIQSTVYTSLFGSVDDDSMKAAARLLLCRLYNITEFPFRHERIDISHFMSRRKVAALDHYLKSDCDWDRNHLFCPHPVLPENQVFPLLVSDEPTDDLQYTIGNPVLAPLADPLAEISGYFFELCHRLIQYQTAEGSHHRKRAASLLNELQMLKIGVVEHEPLFKLVKNQLLILNGNNPYEKRERTQKFQQDIHNGKIDAYYDILFQYYELFNKDPWEFKVNTNNIFSFVEALRHHQIPHLKHYYLSSDLSSSQLDSLRQTAQQHGINEVIKFEFDSGSVPMEFEPFVSQLANFVLQRQNTLYLFAYEDQLFKCINYINYVKEKNLLIKELLLIAFPREEKGLSSGFARKSNVVEALARFLLETPTIVGVYLNNMALDDADMNMFIALLEERAAPFRYFDISICTEVQREVLKTMLLQNQARALLLGYELPTEEQAFLFDEIKQLEALPDEFSAISQQLDEKERENIIQERLRRVNPIFKFALEKFAAVLETKHAKRKITKKGGGNTTLQFYQERGQRLKNKMTALNGIADQKQLFHYLCQAFIEFAWTQDKSYVSPLITQLTSTLTRLSYKMQVQFGTPQPKEIHNDKKKIFAQTFGLRFKELYNASYTLNEEFIESSAIVPTQTYEKVKAGIIGCLKAGMGGIPAMGALGHGAAAACKLFKAMHDLHMMQEIAHSLEFMETIPGVHQAVHTFEHLGAKVIAKITQMKWLSTQERYTNFKTSFWALISFTQTLQKITAEVVHRYEDQINLLNQEQCADFGITVADHLADAFMLGLFKDQGGVPLSDQALCDRALDWLAYKPVATSPIFKIKTHGQEAIDIDADMLLRGPGLRCVRSPIQQDGVKDSSEEQTFYFFWGDFKVKPGKKYQALFSSHFKTSYDYSSAAKWVGYRWASEEEIHHVMTADRSGEYKDLGNGMLEVWRQINPACHQFKPEELTQYTYRPKMSYFETPEQRIQILGSGQEALAKQVSLLTGTTLQISPKDKPRSDSATSWYSEQQVNALIAHYCTEFKNFDCISPTLGTKSARGIEFKDIFKQYNEERLKQGETVKEKVIIPLNLNKNHWVLVYLDYTLGNIYYCDPLGALMPENIRDIIRSEVVFSNAGVNPLFPGNHYQMAQRLQQDGYNCGPWVVEVARAIMRTEGELVHGIERASCVSLDMSQARKEHFATLSLIENKNKTNQSAASDSTKSCEQAQSANNFNSDVKKADVTLENVWEIVQKQGGQIKILEGNFANQEKVISHLTIALQEKELEALEAEEHMQTLENKLKMNNIPVPPRPKEINRRVSQSPHLIWASSDISYRVPLDEVEGKERMGARQVNNRV